MSYREGYVKRITRGYDPDATCYKCGGDSVTTCYCPTGRISSICYYINTEHMHRYCGRCHHEWLERVVQLTTAKLPPPDTSEVMP